MLTYAHDPLRSDSDLDRRRELRSFLVHCRSQLTPAQVGLPETRRRRVRGLRRGEVAELIGASEDWYRSFERGRAVRVSPRFIARLSDALQLSIAERLLLFRLSLPELYELSHSLVGRFSDHG